MEWKRRCTLHRKQTYGIILFLLISKGASKGEKKVQAILGLTSSLAKELYEHDELIKRKSEKLHTKVNELVKDGSQESLDDVAKYMVETINQYSYQMMMNVLLKCFPQPLLKFTKGFDDEDIDDICQFSKQENLSTGCTNVWVIQDKETERFRTCVVEHTRYDINQSEAHAFSQLKQFYDGLLNSTVKDVCKYLNSCCTNKVSIKTNHDGSQGSDVAATTKTLQVILVILSAVCVVLLALCSLLGWRLHKKEKNLTEVCQWSDKEKKNVDANQEDAKVEENITSENTIKERGSLLDKGKQKMNEDDRK